MAGGAHTRTAPPPPLVSYPNQGRIQDFRKGGVVNEQLSTFADSTSGGGGGGEGGAVRLRPIQRAGGGGGAVRLRPILQAGGGGGDND